MDSQKRSVRYEVRSGQGDGTLSYDTFLHVEQAYLAGLIDPGDEVRQVGDTEWKKISSLPQFERLRRSERGIRGAFVPWIVISVVLALVSLILILRGDWPYGLVAAVALTFVLFQLTSRASRKR